MRQPTKEEARTIDLVHADAAIASGEHDLLVLKLRAIHGIIGKDATLPVDLLTVEERVELAHVESKAKTAGVEVQIAIAKLRRECEVSKDAQLIDGKWISPLTRKPYGEGD